MTVIWDHYEFSTNKEDVILDKEKAIYMSCNAELKYHAESTSNL